MCGYRTVAIFGGIASSLFLLGISYSTQLSSLLVCGVCCGFSFGMVFLSSIIVVSFYFERWRGLAQSITSCGSSVGITCFPLIFTIIFANHSWRFKFKILACCGLLCAVCGSFYRILNSVKVVEEIKLPNNLKKPIDRLQIEGRNSKLLSRYNIEYPASSELQRLSTIVVQAPKKISYTSVSDMSFSESILTISSLSRPKISRVKMSVERLHTVYEGQEDKNFPFRERFSDLYQRYCCKCKLKQRENITIVRPLHRDDIFYQGSLATLPEYVKSVQMVAPSQEKASLEYHLSVTRAVTQAEMEQELKPCVCCPESVKRSLATMLDFSVLKSKAFVLISISGLFTVLGLYTPFMFLVDRAVDFGMDRNLAYHLITVIGIANTLGRIISGMTSTLYKFNAFLVSWIGLIISALTIIVSSLSFTVSWQFTSAFVYGFSMGCVVALRPLIIVDIVGLPKLTNGFGISIVFQGIACLIGIPLSGYLKTITNNYQMSFYFAGSVTFISALLLVPVKQIHKREKIKTSIQE
ncbi:hypothetical protein RN001_006662 [Aquatica leii]|uniref:Major facilitator superfamily (MFS) profile domain-containing protein n=1 Tax=Aquatica leii TaxID=1421715 RepID=A0AAN7PEB5_9COLE|nr:hypothetical protein RN001_006662 [Aquatica leii]